MKMIEDNKWSTFMHPQIVRKLIYEKITTIANFVTTESHHLLQSETVISFSISAGCFGLWRRWGHQVRWQKTLKPHLSPNCHPKLQNIYFGDITFWKLIFTGFSKTL